MSTLRLEVPAKMLPFATEPRRHKVARGGRGSGKSWSVARILAVRGFAQPTRWLCCREVQKSIKQSSHRLLSDQIRELGLGGWYDIQRDVIRGPNGTEFAFAGLQDHTIDSIKSYEGFHGAWVEEAQSVSERSGEILIPTIRAPGSEIWWTYNPTLESDFVHRRFTASDDETLVVEINWQDNPWFPAELDVERRRLLRLKPDLYRHVWEGACRSDSGAWIKRHWFRHYRDAPALLRVYLTTDWATTEDGGDWTVHALWGVDTGGDLYALDWYRAQVNTGVGIDAALSMVERWTHRGLRPRVWFGERGVIERAIGPSIAKRMRERGVHVHRELLPTVGSKADRCVGFAARAEYGSVYLPEPSVAPWVAGLLDELCAFTGEREGEVDDQADACGLIGRAVDRLLAPHVQPPAPDIQPFTARWLMHQDDEDAARDRPRIA